MVLGLCPLYILHLVACTFYQDNYWKYNQKQDEKQEESQNMFLGHFKFSNRKLSDMET